MLYYIIETTNLINNKKYRGIHSSKSDKDSYLGSAVQLKKDIKEFGKENFSKVILEFFISKEQMIKKSIDFITDDWLKRPDTYNICRGGISTNKILKVQRTQKDKKAISRGMKLKYKEGLITTKGKKLAPLSEEHKKKISDGMKRIYEDGHIGMKGKKVLRDKMTEEEKELFLQRRADTVEKRKEIATVNEFVFKLKF